MLRDSSKLFFFLTIGKNTENMANILLVNAELWTTLLCPIRRGKAVGIWFFALQIFLEHSFAVGREKIKEVFSHLFLKQELKIEEKLLNICVRLDKWK